MANRNLAVIAIVLAIVILFTLSGVSTGDDGLNLPLPADMCYQDGKPVIYSSSLDGHASLSLSYLNTSGQVITQRYGRPAFSTEWVADIQVVMDGATC
jgi:hypothetical protein